VTFQANAMTVPTFTGQRVTLRAVQPEDEPARLNLGWHAGIQRSYGRQVQTREMTPAEARDWYERQQARAADPAGRDWVIEAEGQLAGVTCLHALKETDRKAHFVIGMFAPSHLGRGLGTEATRLVLAHAFGSMNLHRVDLRVLAFNVDAIASYRKCGFVEEGRERESCWLEGQWHDDIIMGVLATEFPGLGSVS
jgi:RimJ/RimL family protein N-acetyltransferase